MADLTGVFFFPKFFFTNLDPFLRGFSTPKIANFTSYMHFFFFFFGEMGPSFKDFLTKMELMSKDFFVKKYIFT